MVTRKFGGIAFREADAAPTKARANGIAKHWRKKGWKARIVKKKNSYTIYVRKGAEAGSKTRK